MLQQVHSRVHSASYVLNNSISYIFQGNQEDGPAYEANPGDEVTYHCQLEVFSNKPYTDFDFWVDKYNDSTGKVDQTVLVNGNIVSTLSTCMSSEVRSFLSILTSL